MAYASIKLPDGPFCVLEQLEDGRWQASFEQGGIEWPQQIYDNPNDAVWHLGDTAETHELLCMLGIAHGNCEHNTGGV